MELNNEGLFFASGYQKLFALSVFFTLIIAETYFMHRAIEKNIVRRSYSLNLRIFLFNDIVMNLLSVSSLLLVAESCSGFGLLNIVQNVPLKIFLSFTLYDLMQYWLHRARHENKFLWRFHKVHHSDKDMNTTTALRLHVAEVLLTTMAKAVFIAVMGVPVLIFALCEVIITAIVMMNHANISFRGERLLSYVFIVPCKHVVHHSAYWKEHESNFGFALSVWDRIFGTCKMAEPNELGLPNMKEPDFWETLFLTFKKRK